MKKELKNVMELILTSNEKPESEKHGDIFYLFYKYSLCLVQNRFNTVNQNIYVLRYVSLHKDFLILEFTENPTFGEMYT